MPPELPNLPDGPFPYEVERLAGAGGEGQVWRAKGPEGRWVALKVGREEARRHQLANEATRLLFAASTHLPALYDLGWLPPALCSELKLSVPSPFLALEWIEGHTPHPAQLPDSERWATALTVARDVASTLHDLHSVGMAHGDVKPDNVLLSANVERARLVDLGLAFAAAEAGGPRGGTPRYLAPERAVAAGGTSHGASWDLYALGLTIAEIASGSVASSKAPAIAIEEASLGPELDELVRPLVRAAPAARPGARWVARRASRALGLEPPPSRVALAPCDWQRAYLAVRRAELQAAAQAESAEILVAGEPGRWLKRAVRLLRRIAELRGAPPSAPPVRIGELDTLGRKRLLLRCLGPQARDARSLDSRGDARLVERLRELATTLNSHGSLDVRAPGPRTRTDSGNAVALAVALSDGTPSEELLDRAEQHLADNPRQTALGLQLASALRLQQQLGRALALLERLEGHEARVEAAEVARRAGDVASAHRKLEGVALTELSPETHARGAATRARMLMGERRLREALEALEGAPFLPCTAEARVMVHVRRGDFDRAEADLLAGFQLATRAEQRARLEFLSGRVAHGRNDYQAALASFARAADFASQCGALLEEATYLSGVAAAAAELGEVGRALAAADRAMLVYEALGRPQEAARAALSRAGTLLSIGAREEALDAADTALRLATEGGDRACMAFAHLCKAECCGGDQRRAALEHLARAEPMLQGSDSDVLRVTALRLWIDPRAAQPDEPRSTELASDSRVAAEARLAYWGARAHQALERGTRESADERVLSETARLVSSHASVAVRGRAFGSASRLAARCGDGELSRRFSRLAIDAGELLRKNAPAELAPRLMQPPFATAATDDALAVSPEQLRNVDALVRSLTTRHQLRPLLDQVLDALVLWTGVERGLLLLTAPGNRLLPRAARNLAREDLDGAQLELSHSLARRAIQTRQPVVAVDAVGELPEHHESVHALKLRSLLAIPMFYRGETLGVVYLDDRVRTGAFGPRELSWVRLIASIASVAIGDARDQLSLRRAVRRARRAEKKLEAALFESRERLELAERQLADRTTTRRPGYDNLVGESLAMEKLITLIDRVSNADVPVLVLGESGAGKELVARAIHDHGARRDQAFVSENCSAIPEGLLESTLFGHVRGAFTGANQSRAGLFRLAHQGTLFLDEIGEMSLAMQAKLLRVLETGEVRPLGSETTQVVDVRVVGATQRDLEEMVNQGRFRSDLYYRLNVVSIRVPSLRERREDVALLARHFVAKHDAEGAASFSPEAIGCLEAYAWPGNVRELENEVRRALVMAESRIGLEHLSPRVRGQHVVPAVAGSMHVRTRIDQLETQLVREALKTTRGNQTRAAELLGLSRFGLQKMMKRLHISKSDL